MKKKKAFVISGIVLLLIGIFIAVFYLLLSYIIGNQYKISQKQFYEHSLKVDNKYTEIKSFVQENIESILKLSKHELALCTTDMKVIMMGSTGEYQDIRTKLLRRKSNSIAKIYPEIKSIEYYFDEVGIKRKAYKTVFFIFYSEDNEWISNKTFKKLERISNNLYIAYEVQDRGV